MNKVIKIILFNIIFFILLFLSAESVSIFEFAKNNLLHDDSDKKISFLDIVKEEKEIVFSEYFEQDFKKYINNDGFRKPSVGEHYKGEDIILAGCSFTWGDYLEYKDTFGAVLTKFFPKYKVYNIGLNGASPRETLYILRNYKKYQNQKILPVTTKQNDVKYFIYTAISDHKNRLFINHRFCVPTPLYKVKKSKNGEKYLKFYESDNPIYKTFTYRFFANKYIPPKIFDGYMKDLFTLYMQEIKKEIDIIYPNAKFVLFTYYQDFYSENEFDEQAIENLGIKVVELNKISETDFSEQKYRINYHPNGKAWREIVPQFGKELNL